MMSWTIQTGSTAVDADWLEGSLFDTAPGSEITATFAFVEWGDGDPAERHAALQSLADAAIVDTTIRTGMTASGTPYYRETLSAHAVDSLLVALIPDDNDARGAVWAVLRDATDATPAAERDVFVWELELTILKRYDAETREEIETQFRDEVI